MTPIDGLAVEIACTDTAKPGEISALLQVCYHNAPGLEPRKHDVLPFARDTRFPFTIFTRSILQLLIARCILRTRN